MKLLHFDIETSPMLGWFWGNNLYEQDILKVEQDTFLLCFAYQWHHAGEVEIVSQRNFGAYKKDRRNDVGVVKALWKLLDEADAVLAHNGKQFDIKKANTRFILLGMPPPSPYRVLDTKQIAKKNFSFPMHGWKRRCVELDGNLLQAGCGASQANLPPIPAVDRRASELERARGYTDLMS